MEVSKIRLSPAEAALFNNAEVILTKNAVLQKTVALLTDVQATLLAIAAEPLRRQSPPPKISKGENYRGLPYVVLDYPRIATAEGLLFVRSLFWWGHFFSSTLQLAGFYKQQHLAAITESYSWLQQTNYVVGINTDPWVHHFGPDNVQPIRKMSAEGFAAALHETPHLKIAASWPLADWDTAAEKLVESWKRLTALIGMV